MLSERNKDDRLMALATKIAEYIKDHRSGPTVREVAGMMGVKSMGMAHKAILDLEQKGVIERTFGQYRSIRMSNQGD